MNKVHGWLSSNHAKRLLSCNNFQLLLLILSGTVAVFFVAEALRFLPVTGDNIYPESAGVLAAQHWAKGLPLYADYRRPPYLMTSFTPLWYGFLAIAAKSGLSKLDSLVLFGRILSFATLFGSVILGYMWNRAVGFSWPRALLTPAFFLSLPILIPWAVTARPDFPAVFLAMLAIYCAGLRSSKASVCFAGLAASSAFLIRHNSVAAPVAIVLWLVWSKRWKHAGLFCAVCAFVGTAVLLPFELTSHGSLVLNLSSAKFGKFAFTYAHDVLARLLNVEGAGFAVALFALGSFGFLQSLKESDRRIHLVSIYFVVSMVLAVLGTAAAGGGVNHYFEAALALAVLIPVGMLQLETEWRTESPLAMLAVVTTLALILPALDVQRSNALHKQPDDIRPFASLLENRRVFTDDPYLAARTSAPQAVDLSSLTNTEKRGGWAAWSSSGIAEALQQRKYDLVILRTPMREPYFPYNPASRYPRTHRLDSALQNAIIQNYRLCMESDSSEEYGSLHVYAPHSDDASVDICTWLKTSVPQQRSAGTIALAK